MHCTAKRSSTGDSPTYFGSALAVAKEDTHILFFYISVNMASQAVPADVQDTPIPTVLQADELLTERRSSTAMTSKVLEAVPVSQDIWHPRKFGTPIPNILGYSTPTYEIWHPLRPRNFSTPMPSFLGNSAPPRSISRLTPLRFSMHDQYRDQFEQ